MMQFIRLILFLCMALLFSTSCSKKVYRPSGDFQAQLKPTAPDYSSMACWAAHPDKEDYADRTPGKRFTDKQAEAEVDVFFIYPTIYTGEKNQDQWNAPVDDPKFNKKVDKSTILNQASIFNGAGRVFAPRYRQAHIHAYYSSDKEAAKAAFELAYQDVREAFAHYLKHENQGRPFIIASHSQGTTHAGPLLREFVDGKGLASQFVAAYIVGIEVPEDYFENIPPCASPEQTGCFCSWRTWQRGYLPKHHDPNNNYAVTNPLNWAADTTHAPASLNLGAVLYKFKKPKKELVDAQVHQGLLWVEKPKFFGSRLIKTKNFHVGDYNLFYVNVRKNAMLRASEFLHKNRK